MKKFLSLIAVIALVISLVKLGEWMGYRRGFAKGLAISKKIEELRPKCSLREVKLVVDESALDSCIEGYDELVDKANYEIKELKEEMRAAENRYEEEIQSNLYPETVKEKEPKMDNYQGDSDYEASGFNLFTEEYEND